jgi:uncharacterized C2H2 Zn-finger protein
MTRRARLALKSNLLLLNCKLEHRPGRSHKFAAMASVDGSCKCAICGAEGPDALTLQVHRWNTHGHQLAFRCWFCRYGFDTGSQLRAHITAWHDELVPDTILNTLPAASSPRMRTVSCGAAASVVDASPRPPTTARGPYKPRAPNPMLAHRLLHEPALVEPPEYLLPRDAVPICEEARADAEQALAAADAPVHAPGTGMSTLAAAQAAPAVLGASMGVGTTAQAPQKVRQPDPRKKSLICGRCRMVFSRSDALGRHVVNIHNTKRQHEGDEASSKK